MCLRARRPLAAVQGYCCFELTAGKDHWALSSRSCSRRQSSLSAAAIIVAAALSCGRSLRTRSCALSLRIFVVDCLSYVICCCKNIFARCHKTRRLPKHSPRCRLAVCCWHRTRQRRPSFPQRPTRLRLCGPTPHWVRPAAPDCRLYGDFFQLNRIAFLASNANFMRNELVDSS